MTRFQQVVRAGARSWIATPLCGAVFVLGCGSGTAPDPTHRASPPNAAGIESNDTPWNEAAGDLSGDEPAATAASARERPRRVVGYLPTYRLGDSPQLHLDTLTHLIIAFAVPNPKNQNEAHFPNVQPGDVESLVKLAHASDVKVLAALGGGAGGEDTSRRLKADVGSYVESVLNLVRGYELDGVDVDIEGEAIDPVTYEQLMLGLSKQLRPERKLLTAAVAGYLRQNYRVLGAVDFLNVMSYDQCGGWGPGTACEHSTQAQAEIDLEYWSAFEQADEIGTIRRIGAENVVLGVPFYGRCWGERCPDRVLDKDGKYARATDLAYSKIVAYCADGRFSGCSTSADVLTDGDDVRGYYVSLNSPSTIQSKAERAKSYGGIMIWELGQDARDAALFAAIEKEFPKRTRVSDFESSSGAD